KEGEFDEEIVQLGGRVHRIPYITDVGHARYIRAMVDFFCAHRSYRIVHSHMDRMSGLVLRAAKKAGLPVRIAHSHSTNSEGGLPAKLYKKYSSLYIPSSATHLLACSKAAAQWLYGTNALNAY